MPTKQTRRKNSVDRPVRSAASRRASRCAAAQLGARRFFHPLTLRIVGEREGRELNRTFRKIDRATNVLSFAYDKRGGDIVLCHPVIRREAHAQGKSVAAHYAHLVVHGVLHLRGYAHEKKRDAARMEAREIRILRRVGIT